MRQVVPGGIPCGSPEADPKWDPKHGPKAGSPVTVGINCRDSLEAVCGVSGSTSIDLTVEVESPPEAWMDLDDLNLLDDGRVHCICTNCAPLRLPPLTEFVALCGARAVCRVGLVADCDGTECVDCLDVDVCPNCGTWF